MINNIYIAVRNAMEIDIRNHVIILDEAHNVEDVSRDSGSLEIAEDDLEGRDIDYTKYRRNVIGS
jgi:Rad3-related DNA helicase